MAVQSRTSPSPPNCREVPALWLAFAVLNVVAGAAIAVTGRYPRGIFDFNVGVLPAFPGLKSCC